MFLLVSARQQSRPITHVSPMILPPPSPWNARATINHVMFLAAPHNADAMKKTTIAEYTLGFRPMMSETRPFRGFITVAARRYARMFSV